MLTFNLNKYEINNNGIMLDVGCGEGRHIFGIMQDYPQMKCIGLDMDNASLVKAEEGYEYFESISKAGAEFIKGSAYSLPFPDDSIDLIVCSEVLEHLHQYNNAIKEIHRVLKPGGYFIIDEIDFPEKREDMRVNQEFPDLKTILKKINNKENFESKYIKQDEKSYFLNNVDFIKFYKGNINEFAIVKKND